jgi:hypothetical protein
VARRIAANVAKLPVLDCENLALGTLNGETQ